jgi:spermidine/putrescine-binding protein
VSRRDVLKIGVFTAAGAAVGGALGFVGGSASRQQDVDSLTARLRALEREFNLPALAPQISMYNWTVYTNYALLDAFEKKWGIQMNYVDTAEEEQNFRDQLKAGNPNRFDIMVVTDYAVQEAIELDLLEPLNKDYIPNIDNLDETFPTPWDPNHDYSLPYLWGTTGIGWNTTLCQFPSGQSTVNSWNQLFDTGPNSFLDLNQDHVTIQADRDEALAAAATYLGRSINDLSQAALDEIETTLKAVKGYLASSAPFADATTYLDGLSSDPPLFWASHAWSGDVLFVREAYGVSDVTYTVPDEGGHLWTDNYVIPKNAPNRDTALVFINFMWEAANAAVLAMFRNYMVPNKLTLSGGQHSQDAFNAYEEPIGMILPHVLTLPDFNPLTDPARAPLMQTFRPRTEAENNAVSALWDRVQAYQP